MGSWTSHKSISNFSGYFKKLFSIKIEYKKRELGVSKMNSHECLQNYVSFYIYLESQDPTRRKNNVDR